MVHAMTRSGSDHTPLIIDSGKHAHLGNKAMFSFELSWLRKEGFYDLITREWNSVTTGSSPIERWQNKIRHLRQYLRGWAKNISGEYKKLKQKLILLIDELDIKAETSTLTTAECAVKKEADERMAQLRRDEESKWAQRAKVKHVQEGGNNTKYFHLIANGKHRKKIIFQLEQDEGTIVGENNLKVFISEYYKRLFGAPDPCHFSLEESFIADLPQITPQENSILTSVFTEKEVFEAISQMELNKAPGPDGFPAEFYQKFWLLIKADLMAMFTQLHCGDLPLFQLNFGVITLLPKKVDACRIEQYRPICLLNVSFKIFTKVGTNRVSSIAQKVIRPTQTAFMPGRNILEGVVILHETIH